MKKIILIIPYFGKLPNYFPLWLKSIEYNPTINFLLITDDKTKYSYPKNIKVIYSQFEEIQKKIKNIFDFNVKINKPYKLCDYRPFYNIIFDSEIKNYDFWGYCDIDLIFGNIRKFLTDEILEEYEKIYTRGHLTLFKNSLKVNSAIRYTKINPNFYNYKEALTTDYACHFDEWGGISRIFLEENVKQYDNIDFADLDVKDYNFKMLFEEKLKNKYGIFEWNKGKLEFITKNNVKKEVIYAHFQKRKMQVEVSNFEAEKFTVVPNKFLNYTKVDEKLLNKYTNSSINVYIINNFKYYKKRIKGIIEKAKNGAIKQRLYRFKKKIIRRNQK